jgi:hypothetical protein
MFLDRVDEAHDLYLSNRAERLPEKQVGEDLIRHDFELMRKEQLVQPLMQELEIQFDAVSQRKLVR